MLQDQFKPAIQIKHQGILLKGAAILHYNAHPHQLSFEVLKHPPYYSDYYIFGPLKEL
jgi:hypothetical protein